MSNKREKKKSLTVRKHFQEHHCYALVRAAGGTHNIVTYNKYTASAQIEKKHEVSELNYTHTQKYEIKSFLEILILFFSFFRSFVRLLYRKQNTLSILFIYYSGELKSNDINRMNGPS